MSSKTPNPNLHKTIFRTDFLSGPEYISTFASVATLLKGYPQWEVEGGRITLKDPEKRRSATLDVGAIIYEQDSGDKKLEIQSIDDILKIWPPSLKISEYLRFGLRKKFLISEKIAYEQLVSLLNSKMFRLESFSSFIPKINDSHIRFDCVEQPNQFHVSIGPVRKREIFNVLEINRNHLDPRGAAKDAQKVIEAFPETAIYLDVDFYCSQGDLIPENVTNFLIEGQKRIDEIAMELSAYLFGE